MLQAPEAYSPLFVFFFSTDLVGCRPVWEDERDSSFLVYEETCLQIGA